VWPACDAEGSSKRSLFIFFGSHQSRVAALATAARRCDHTRSMAWKPVRAATKSTGATVVPGGALVKATEKGGPASMWRR
jgi:hypothetical protein